MLNKVLCAAVSGFLLFAAGCSPKVEDGPSASTSMDHADVGKQAVETGSLSGISGNLQIPRSIKLEHDAIHRALVDATRASGDVGEAARALADVLHPHFVREEEIALPPLFLLAPLAVGQKIDSESSAHALEMTDALKKEMPKMLEEHKAIRAAVQKLREAASKAGDKVVEQLAEDLTLHAQNEEEITYPAAVLVGEILKARA